MRLAHVGLVCCLLAAVGGGRPACLYAQDAKRDASARLLFDEGVGLLRTEFLFLERTRPPSEEEQFKAYSAMTRALNGLPLIIRTLDIGGDKVVPYLPQAHEDNPFLGVRGIRLCLAKPELFLPQLRAIYRASVTGPVKIMFPMIATLEDLRAGKAIAEQVRAELGVPPVEIGMPPGSRTPPKSVTRVP